jgi:hypothetical protein
MLANIQDDPSSMFLCDFNNKEAKNNHVRKISRPPYGIYTVQPRYPNNNTTYSIYLDYYFLQF